MDNGASGEATVITPEQQFELLEENEKLRVAGEADQKEIARLNEKQIEIETALAKSSEDFKGCYKAYNELQDQVAASKSERLEPPAVFTTENVTVKFLRKRFNYNGQIYVSADVEAAAKAEDVAALNLIAELVKIKAGVIEIVKQGGE